MTITATASAIVDTPSDDAVAVGTVNAAEQRRATTQQFGRFLTVGAVCTAFFTVLYVALKTPVGGEVANTIALVLAAILNTALNRRHTFRVRGHTGATSHHAKGLVILTMNWALSTGALLGLRLVDPSTARVTEIAILTVANLVATALRFTLMRRWVFPS